MTLTLNQAQAAHQTALNRGIKETTPIVDAEVHLVALLRMDGTLLGAVDLAFKKARTACPFNMPTAELEKASQPGQLLFGIEHANGGLVTFAGGLPLVDDGGPVVGAIGASGGTPADDHAIAQAGVQAAAPAQDQRPVIVTMMYPTSDGVPFDHEYYMNEHMPRVRGKWGPLGMLRDQVLRGLPGPNGEPPVYVLTCLMTFASMASFNEAVAQHGEELYGDVLNFTKIPAVRMFGEAAAGA